MSWEWGWLSVNKGFGEPSRRIYGRVGVILKWLGFGEVAVEFWVKSCILEWAELQEAEGKEQHGSSTRTVQVRHAFLLPYTGQLHRPCKRESVSARVSCTDRVRDIGLARVLSTGRIREACRTYLPHTGRAEQHGPCSYFGLHGSQRLCTGRVSWLSTGRADWHGSR